MVGVVDWGVWMWIEFWVGVLVEGMLLCVVVSVVLRGVGIGVGWVLGLILMVWVGGCECDCDCDCGRGIWLDGVCEMGVVCDCIGVVGVWDGV